MVTAILSLVLVLLFLLVIGLDRIDLGLDLEQKVFENIARFKKP